MDEKLRVEELENAVASTNENTLSVQQTYYESGGIQAPQLSEEHSESH